MRCDHLNEEDLQNALRHAVVLRRLPLRPTAGLTCWGMEKETIGVPVGSVLSLLLSPVRKASPAAPWELARLRMLHLHELSVQSKRFRRPPLTIVVPEFRVAVPIYDQQLPSDLAQLSAAPWTERYALAIGFARVLNNPGDRIGNPHRSATLPVHCTSTNARNSLSPPKMRKGNFSTLTNGRTAAFMSDNESRDGKIPNSVLSHLWPKVGGRMVATAES